MMLSEILTFDWYVIASIIIALIAIGVLVCGIVYQLLKGSETWFTRLLDKGTVWLAQFMQEHYSWLEDEEPTCPEWADEALWKESLK